MSLLYPPTEYPYPASHKCIDNSEVYKSNYSILIFFSCCNDPIAPTISCNSIIVNYVYTGC